jgi:hypothetical protein
MGVATSAVRRLAQYVDERAAWRAQDVPLFGAARERGLLDARRVRQAQAA